MAQQTMVQEMIAACSADPKSEKCEEEVTILIGAAIGHINSFREEERKKRLKPREAAETLVNGNISDFKAFLHVSSKIEMLDAIEALQSFGEKRHNSINRIRGYLLPDDDLLKPLDREKAKAARELVQGVIR